MTIRAVIPAKPFDTGKSRLASLCPVAERAALNRAFLLRTMEVVAQLLPPGQITVVSASAEVRALAKERGLDALADPPGGDLNQALAHAAADARGRGAAHILSISSDLPELSAEDVAAMIASPDPHGIVIAPDRHGVGTNALCVPADAGMPYLHGAGSFEAHRRAAVALGLAVRVVDRPGLTRDIDEPGDLKAFRGG